MVLYLIGMKVVKPRLTGIYSFDAFLMKTAAQKHKHKTPQVSSVESMT